MSPNRGDNFKYERFAGQDQEKCPFKRGVLLMEVFESTGSTLYRARCTCMLNVVIHLLLTNKSLIFIYCIN